MHGLNHTSNNPHSAPVIVKMFSMICSWLELLDNMPLYSKKHIHQQHHVIRMLCLLRVTTVGGVYRNFAVLSRG